MQWQLATDFNYPLASILLSFCAVALSARRDIVLIPRESAALVLKTIALMRNFRERELLDSPSKFTVATTYAYAVL